MKARAAAEAPGRRPLLMRLSASAPYLERKPGQGLARASSLSRPEAPQVVQAQRSRPLSLMTAWERSMVWCPTWMAEGPWTRVTSGAKGQLLGATQGVASQARSLRLRMATFWPQVPQLQLRPLPWAMCCEERQAASSEGPACLALRGAQV